VFVTNFLPDARERLKIDVDDVQAVNPQIIYVRGSAFGAKGPDEIHVRRTTDACHVGTEVLRELDCRRT
jgi:hypothetical protein